MFSTAVAVLFAKVGSALPQAFIEDRSKFSGREFNPQAMKAAEPRMLDAFRAQLHWLETNFADGKPFLFGPQPSAGDCSLYHMVWFVRSGRPEALAEFPAILAWADRLASIGHGVPSAIDAREAKGHPVPRCSCRQNSRTMTATIEASFGCTRHPRPRRYVVPLGWLASRQKNTSMCSSISCAGS